MDDKLARIMKIGFVMAGSWKLNADKIAVELNGLGSARNILYCFLVDDELKYIGKSTNTLHHRMQRYKTPPKDAKNGSTNIKNNFNIRQHLERGQNVAVLVLPDNGLLYYGGFHVNLAAGLEDSLIKELDPPWNGGKKETSAQSLEPIVVEGNDQ